MSVAFMFRVWHTFITWKKGVWAFQTLVRCVVQADASQKHQRGPFGDFVRVEKVKFWLSKTGTGGLWRTLFIRSMSLCCHVCSRMETSSKPINQRNARVERIAPNIIVPPNLSLASAETHVKNKHRSMALKHAPIRGRHASEEASFMYLKWLHLRDESSECKRTHLSKALLRKPQKPSLKTQDMLTAQYAEMKRSKRLYSSIYPPLRLPANSADLKPSHNEGITTNSLSNSLLRMLF